MIVSANSGKIQQDLEVTEKRGGKCLALCALASRSDLLVDARQCITQYSSRFAMHVAPFLKARTLCRFL